MQDVFRIDAGAPDSPVILHVPHSSRHITAAARPHILLDDDALTAELDRMTDSHTDLIANRAAAGAATTPWTFTNLASRLVVDPERFPDDREEMRAVGMGAVYTKTSSGDGLRSDDNNADDQSHTADLIATHYEPYAAAISALVDDRAAATGRAVIVDVHSYPLNPLPYELHADGHRPRICLGVDPDHTPPALIAAAAEAFTTEGDIAVNTPFAGCYVPLKHYRQNTKVEAIMIEIRRDIYMVEPGGPPTAGISGLVAAVTRLIDTIGSARGDREPQR